MWGGQARMLADCRRNLVPVGRQSDLRPCHPELRGLTLSKLNQRVRKSRLERHPDLHLQLLSNPATCRGQTGLNSIQSLSQFNPDHLIIVIDALILFYVVNRFLQSEKPLSQTWYQKKHSPCENVRKC